MSRTGPRGGDPAGHRPVVAACGGRGTSPTPPIRRSAAGPPAAAAGVPARQLAAPPPAVRPAHLPPVRRRPLLPLRAPLAVARRQPVPLPVARRRQVPLQVAGRTPVRSPRAG